MRVDNGTLKISLYDSQSNFCWIISHNCYFPFLTLPHYFLEIAMPFSSNSTSFLSSTRVLNLNTMSAINLTSVDYGRGKNHNKYMAFVGKFSFVVFVDDVLKYTTLKAVTAFSHRFCCNENTRIFGCNVTVPVPNVPRVRWSY